MLLLRIHCRSVIMPDCSSGRVVMVMRQLALLLLISMCLTACATLETRERESAFDEASNVYGKAIRWSDFETAEQLRRLDAEHTARPRPADDIRVTSYKTVRMKPAADGNEIAVTVRITYYHDDAMTLKEITDQQLWKYNADEQSWHIATPLPEFK